MSTIAEILPSALSARDLAVDPGAGPDRLADVVEHLGEVAADLAVDLDRLHDPLEVVAAACARPPTAGRR